jgi:hypothetical protein
VSGVFRTIGPHPISTQPVCPPSSPKAGGGGINTRRAVRGWWVNISEDARHWICLLQHNPSTPPPNALFHIVQQPRYILIFCFFFQDAGLKFINLNFRDKGRHNYLNLFTFYYFYIYILGQWQFVTQKVNVYMHFTRGRN